LLFFAPRPRTDSDFRLARRSRDGRVLYGKTGWRFSSTPNLGPGWVERDGKVFAFALNIDMPVASDGPKRVAIGKACWGSWGFSKALSVRKVPEAPLVAFQGKPR
jgi:hypothetical protein